MTESTDVLGKLGIHAELLVAQAVNFLLILIVLWKWVYRPLLAKIHERSAEIKRGLHQAKEADRAWEQASEEYRRIVDQARREAQETLEKATVDADRVRQEKLVLAKQEMEKVVQDAKLKIDQERTATFDALRRDVAVLVTSSLEKVLSQIDPKTREQITHETVKHLS